MGLLLVIGLNFVWELHPWLSAGQDVHITDQRLGAYDCQVWQRKNESIVEPFTTGIFVRNQGNPWRGFWVGFEDSFHPRIVIRKEGRNLVVTFDGNTIGMIDEDLSAFKRRSDGSSFPPAVINGDPPGNWWLEARNTTTAPAKR